MPIQFSFSSAVDSFEREADRYAVRFTDKVGLFWVATANVKALEPLRRSLATGAELEVTYDTKSLEITDSKEL